MIKTFPLDSLSDKLSDPFKSYVYDFCVKFNYGDQLLDLVVELGGDPYCPVFTH